MDLDAYRRAAGAMCEYCKDGERPTWKSSFGGCWMHARKMCGAGPIWEKLIIPLEIKGAEELRSGANKTAV